MPPFGGFNLGSIGGALVRNVVGDIASQVLPRTGFGGFGLGAVSDLIRPPQQNSQDRRVSLRPKPAAASRVYGNGLLKPLAETGGLIWPYTPTIGYNHNIDYQSIATVHANQDFHVYNRTPAVELQVSGDFSVQNQIEGRYALAAIHFLRTMAKMNFGDKDPAAGTPPPVLLFNAYGPFVFKDLPVIVKSFQAEFPDGVDYVEVGVQGLTTTIPITIERTFYPEPTPAEPVSPNGQGWTVERELRGSPVTAPNNYTVWLPSVFKISASLVIQHTPKDLRSRFELPRFIDGDIKQKDFV
jgi:hypothetical protein